MERPGGEDDFAASEEREVDGRGAEGARGRYENTRGGPVGGEEDLLGEGVLVDGWRLPVLERGLEEA